MQHKRVRTDNFLSGTQLLRVTGRSGYETSTDLWLERDVDITLDPLPAARTETRVVGFHLIGDLRYDVETYDRVNGVGTINIPNLGPGSLNNTLKNVRFRPVGSNNHYDCYPQTQRKILPYLVPSDGIDNIDNFNSRKIVVEGDFEDTMPKQHFYDGTHNRNWVLTTTEDAQERDTGLINPDSLGLVGFCPRDLIEFGTLAPNAPAADFVVFDTSYQIPVYYDKNEDELSLNPNSQLAVRINRSVLGLGAGNSTVFRLNNLNNKGEYDNDHWTIKFDLQGIAGHSFMPDDDDDIFGFKNANLSDRLIHGRGVSNHYRQSEDNYREFLKIILWRVNFTDRFVAYDPPIGGAVVQGQNDDTELVLWMRRPRYTKGEEFNWDFDPGTARFQSWMGKHVDPAAVTLDEFMLTNEPTFYGEFIARGGGITRAVGNMSVEWEGINPNPNGDNVHRRVSSYIFEFDLDYESTYLAIKNPANAAADFALMVTMATPMLHRPFPTAAEQQVPGTAEADYVGDADRNMWFRFQPRHGAFTDAARRIEFARAAIMSGPGGTPGANGVPRFCNDSELFAAVAAGGFQDHAGWMEEPAVGQSLVARNNQVDYGNIANFFTAAHNWATTGDYAHFHKGTFPIFTDDTNTASDFSRHEQKDPGDNDTSNPAILDLLFTQMDEFYDESDVSIAVIDLENHNQNRQFADKARITLREPLFGFKSGMATYNVSRIFTSQPWYPLLLQDVDLHFEESRLRCGRTLHITRKMTAALNFLETTTFELFPPNTVSVEMVSEKKLMVRSRDGRDQRTKLLLEVSSPYPYIRQWTSTLDGVTDVEMMDAYNVSKKLEVRIQIVTDRGMPHYFFIYAIRQYPDDVGYLCKGNPVVTGVRFYGRTNPNKTLSEYLDSKHEVWQATRRNSHPLANLKENYDSVGGVLFTKSDLGTLEHDMFNRSDLLDVDIVVTLANEAPSVFEANNWVKQGVREQYPILVVVAAIYEQGVMLRGGGTALSFVESRDV